MPERQIEPCKFCRLEINLLQDLAEFTEAAIFMYEATTDDGRSPERLGCNPERLRFIGVRFS